MRTLVAPKGTSSMVSRGSDVVTGLGGGVSGERPCPVQCGTRRALTRTLMAGVALAEKGSGEGGFRSGDRLFKAGDDEFCANCLREENG